MRTIIERIKLLGMTAAFTAGQVLAFWFILPAWAAIIYLSENGGD